MLKVSFRHYLFTMVFSKEDKIIIENNYEEKGRSVYKIWKDHSLTNWAYTSVKRLLKHFLKMVARLIEKKVLINLGQSVVVCFAALTENLQKKFQGKKTLIPLHTHF